MTTLAHVTAADNYYLLPLYDDTLRFGEHNEFFGARTIIGGALTSGGPYILDKSTIMLVEKVCGEPPWLRERYWYSEPDVWLTSFLGVEYCRAFAE